MESQVRAVELEPIEEGVEPFPSCGESAAASRASAVKRPRDDKAFQMRAGGDVVASSSNCRDVSGWCRDKASATVLSIPATCCVWS